VLWNLLTWAHWFPWHSRVKVASVGWGRAWSSKFLCVPGSGTYHRVMEPGIMLQGQGVRSVKLTVALLSLPRAFFSLFIDSEKALLIAGCGTPLVPFRVL
jgi:hypothetical protein